MPDLEPDPASDEYDDDIAIDDPCGEPDDEPEIDADD
jgi:hypothetical protein